MPLGQIGVSATVAVTFDLIAPEAGKADGGHAGAAAKE